MICDVNVKTSKLEYLKIDNKIIISKFTVINFISIITTNHEQTLLNVPSTMKTGCNGYYYLKCVNQNLVLISLMNYSR